MPKGDVLDSEEIEAARLVVSAAAMLVMVAKGWQIDAAVQLAVEATDKLFAKLAEPQE
jgi:hypothetical protein